MVRLEIDANGILVAVQQDMPPTVYLDHWALRKISEDPQLSRRFIRTLERCGGTLALSWVNLAEYSKVTDHRQGWLAEEFYAQNLPRIFFLDSDPFSVIQREDELLSGRVGMPLAPHADTGLLSIFAKLKPNSPALFTVRELFRTVQGDQLQSSFNKLGDSLAQGIQVLRNSYDLKPQIRSSVARLPSGPVIQRGTRYVLRELARTFLINQDMKITRNHAIDFMHAVVPLAYCEFVLLDKHWEAQARLVRSRLGKSALNVPLAQVYSEKSIERFFSDLESGS